MLLHQPLGPLPTVEQVPAAETGVNAERDTNPPSCLGRFHDNSDGHHSGWISGRVEAAPAVLCSPVELGEDVDGGWVVPGPRPEHLQVHGGRPVQVRPPAPALLGLDPPQRLLVLPLPLRLPALRLGGRHGSEELEDSPGGRTVTASRG